MFNSAFLVVISLITLLLIVTYLFSRRSISEKNRALIASRRLTKIALESLDFNEVTQKIADTVPKELDFGTGVVAILDKGKGVIRRVAASRTKEAMDAIQSLRVPFNRIEIFINDQNNLMPKALREGKMFVTEDVYDVLGPVLNREEARQLQQIMGTRTTLVYPIYGTKSRPIGVFIASTKKRWSQLSVYERDTIQNFVDEAGIAIDHAMLYENLNTVSKQLEKANIKLMELDQLKDDFVSVTSHELRTPMAAIKSYAWMALHRSGMKLPDNLERYLIRVLLSAERLINLVNDLLNISRIESGRIEIKPETVDMTSLIKDIVDEVYYSKSKEKNIQIIVLEQTLPKVFADPEKLRQVLLNIMGNAIKFSPRDGKITIGFFTDGITVETYIKDEGPGISKDDMGRLFQKFGRLETSYVATATSGGTGLGLYISKSLIELMHGKIWAKSQGLGKGSTFTISLPVATQVVLQDIEKYKVVAKGEAKGLEQVAI